MAKKYKPYVPLTPDEERIAEKYRDMEEKAWQDPNVETIRGQDVIAWAEEQAKKMTKPDSG
jgi:hypothetical protein